MQTQGKRHYLDEPIPVVRKAFLSAVCVCGGVCMYRLISDSAVTFQFQIIPVHMYMIGPVLFYAVSSPEK